MPAASSELYARPLIVFLILCVIILVSFNYIPLIAARADEGFAGEGTAYPSTVCPATAASTTYTTQDVLIPYENTILPKTTEISRRSDGKLTDQALKIYLERLRMEKRIPAAGTVATAEQVAAIAGEFCHINARYEYSLKKFFDGAYRSGTGSDATNFDTWLESARRLNVNLVDMLTLIAEQKDANLSVYASTGAATNMTAVTDRIKSLLEHRTDMSDPESAKKLYAKMVEYTKEKNRANANLIALYSFLNLVALGMLFYIYLAS